MKGSDTDTEIRLVQSKVQGHINDNLGVNIAKTNDDQYLFTKPFLIDTIINDVDIGPKQRKPLQMIAHKLLHHHLDTPPHNPLHFNYRSVVGKLNYLAQISQLDICNAAHQCAKYSSKHDVEHTAAIVYHETWVLKTHKYTYS